MYKRQHTNKFKKLYPNWQYERLNDSNVEECFQMALKWRNKNGCGEDPEKNSEMCVTLNSLRLYKELDLRGGVLRAEGNVVAFSIGEPVSDDTFVVHIEKAFADALKSKTPFVIDCIIDSDDKVWPMVAPGKPINESFDEEDYNATQGGN